MDMYRESHLFVAAIRVLNHQRGFPPSVEDVCSALNFSAELGHSISRNLKKLNIIEIFEDPFTTKLAVANHIEIEKISSKHKKENTLAKELEKFHAEKKSNDKKVETIQAELAKKKKNMLADIDAKFKKEMEKFKDDEK